MEQAIGMLEHERMEAPQVEPEGASDASDDDGQQR